jgi:hypothetical protein
MYHAMINNKIFFIAVIIMIAMFSMIALCFAYSNEQIANAIFKAENSKSHPYGILAHYKHTTPRQACLNTIAHARKDWNGKGEFLLFLRDRYCPLKASNDPTGLNANWLRNVQYYLNKQKIGGDKK